MLLSEIIMERWRRLRGKAPPTRTIYSQHENREQQNHIDHRKSKPCVLESNLVAQWKTAQQNINQETAPTNTDWRGARARTYA
jgi:hypothetical protein